MDMPQYLQGTARITNLADGYKSVVRSIKDDDHFFFDSVTMAVPPRTASDLYGSFERILEDAVINKTHLPQRHSSAQSVRPNVDDMSKIKCMPASRKSPEHSALDTVDCHGSVRSMRVDTGADCTLGDVDLEPHLKGSMKSDAVIGVAKNGVTMATAMDGTFQAYAINNSTYGGTDYSTPVDSSLIPVPDLSGELLEVEKLYDKGYDIHLR